MKITGQFDSDGRVIPFLNPETVYRLGNTLRNKDGMIVAIMDSYGDWVSPAMHSIGIKSKIVLEE